MFYEKERATFSVEIRKENNLPLFTSDGDVEVQVQAVLGLFLDEMQDPLEMFGSSERHPGELPLQTGQFLWTDGSELDGHPRRLPLLDGAGRRHEPQVAAQKGGVLQPEKDLDPREVLARQRNDQSADLAVLGVVYVRTHLRREHLPVTGPDLDQLSEQQRGQGCVREQNGREQVPDPSSRRKEKEKKNRRSNHFRVT